MIYDKDYYLIIKNYLLHNTANNDQSMIIFISAKDVRTVA